MAERPTPLSIAVCILIAFQADPESPYNEVEQDEETKERLVCLVQERVQQGWTNGIGAFLKQIETASGSETTSLVYEYLELASSSIDALIDLMDSLQKAVAEKVIDGSSPRGIYVRKTCLGFDELHFEAVARLWEALKDELEDSSPQEEKRTWPMTPAQLEAELRKQCLSVDSTDRSFEDIELELNNILALDPELPAAHFLRFLVCLRNGERMGALDALHQYFDYEMVEDTKAAAKRAKEEQKEGNTTTTHKQDDKKQILQYAAILLAALHNSFGDELLSSKSTEEAVGVAQQTGDSACVAYALGWLNLNQTGLDMEELLQKCASRAGNLQMLVAGAKMSLARHFRDGNAPISQAWESLWEASATRTDSTTTAMDRSTSITNFISSQDARVVLAKQLLVEAGVWESCGLNVHSGLSSLLALRSYSDCITATDRALVKQNVSRIALHGPAAALPALDFPLSMRKQRDAGRGFDSPCRYATALHDLIDANKSKLPVENVSSVALVLHEWAVRRGELSDAEILTGILYSSLHPRKCSSSPDEIEVLSQHVQLLRRQKQWDRAYDLVKNLCSLCQKTGTRTQQADSLIQLAQIQLESSPNEFIGALEPLLECLSMCERYSMDSHHAAALSILAQIHLRLSNTKQAIALLKASIPSLLQQAHISLVGEAYLTLAKCHLHRAKLQERKGHPIDIRILRSASLNLDRSAEAFREHHDLVMLKEVYYLQARTFDSIPGQRKKRDEASEHFVAACKQLQKSRGPNGYRALGSLVDTSNLQRLASRQLIM